VSNALVLRKLFALAQGKPPKSRLPPPSQVPTPMPNEPTVIPRKLKLPRDASIHYQDYPPQLYLNMTITKVEHIAALSETLETFSRLLDND
jgi:hypothetical protein